MYTHHIPLLDADKTEDTHTHTHMPGVLLYSRSADFEEFEKLFEQSNIQTNSGDKHIRRCTQYIITREGRNRILTECFAAKRKRFLFLASLCIFVMAGRKKRFRIVRI